MEDNWETRVCLIDEPGMLRNFAAGRGGSPMCKPIGLVQFADRGQRDLDKQESPLSARSAGRYPKPEGRLAPDEMILLAHDLPFRAAYGHFARRMR
jgi:hypothetical protein